jgi:hypothetical protein
MLKIAELWRRLLFLLRRGQVDRELEEEMQLHLEMKVEENMGRGMSPEQAHYAALRQFGNQTLLREVSHEMWGLRSLETFWQDVRFGVRMLVKNPSFTVVAVLALALGIGANTAIFSVVNAVLLRPLPYKDPNQLVMVWEDDTKGGYPRDTPAAANYIDWRDQNQVFEGMAAIADLSFL